MGRRKVASGTPLSRNATGRQNFATLREALAREGHEILEKHGIDPLKGLENLTWAPNIKGQHVTKNVEAIVEDLKAVDEAGGDREAIAKVLERHGRRAANLKPAQD